jgi:formamidopyrimidine-DNA glycosylase
VPELPEVETIARDLEGSVCGATVRGVHVHRRDVLRDCSAPALARRLTGATFTRFWRRAKYVVADLSTDERLVVSPRFTGALLVEAAPFRVDRSDYTCIQFPLREILMDQRRVAGIGNIYANEALWRARIRPMRRGTTLTRAEAALLLDEARAVLAAAVEQRGTSFRDYQDPFGGRGGFLGLAKVYGRAGEPCVRCGTALSATHRLERRITVWCAECQQ